VSCRCNRSPNLDILVKVHGGLERRQATKDASCHDGALTFELESLRPVRSLVEHLCRLPDIVSQFRLVSPAINLSLRDHQSQIGGLV
jgi:hypothetical protein